MHMYIYTCVYKYAHTHILTHARKERQDTQTPTYNKTADVTNVPNRFGANKRKQDKVVLLTLILVNSRDLHRHP